MAIDTNIYQNIKPVETPDLMGSAARAMNLSQLIYQNKKLQRDDAKQEAMENALKNSVGSDGTIDRTKLLSNVAQLNPMAAQDYKDRFSKSDKEAADAQNAHLESAKKIIPIALPAMSYLGGLPEERRAAEYNPVMKQLEAQGVPMNNVPKDSSGNYLYDPNHFTRSLLTLKNTADYLGDQKTIAETENSRSSAAKNYAEIGKIKGETLNRNPQILAQVDDPAKLVPNLVPKEHQEAVFKEIDGAQNTKRMSKEIMDNFEKTAEENSKPSSGFGLLTTHGSAGALHQALQPTFKDLEGTVRQAAMDNTFKNVTPAPGDSPQTIETKRQALAQYLQSKASAPRSLAYGIDLSKYDNTAPYQVAKKVDKNSSSVIPEAKASSISPEDAEALHWASRNRNDPRAQQIFQLHGMK